MDPDVEAGLAGIEGIIDDAAPTAEQNGAAPAPHRSGRRAKPVRRRVVAPPQGPPPAPQVTAAPQVAALPSEELRSPQAFSPGETLAPDPVDGTRSAILVWPRILDEQRAQGYTAEQISLRVTRETIGPMRTQPFEMQPIPADLVQGDDLIAPGEALYEYVAYTYHVPLAQGPCKYKFTPIYRGGAIGGGGKVQIRGGACELMFDHPSMVAKQLEGNQRARTAQAMGAKSMPGMPLGSFQTGRNGYGFPIPPAPAATAAPAAPNPQNPREAQLLQQLAQENGYYRGLMEGRGAPQAVPEVRDPRLAPSGLTNEEWEQIQENRTARSVAKAVAQTLTAMGFTPQMMQQQALQQPNVPAAAVQAPTALGAIRDAIGLLKEVTSFQSQVEKILPGGTPAAPGTAPAEPEEDPFAMKEIPGVGTRFGPKLEDESWFEYAVRLGTNNPTQAQEIVQFFGNKLNAESINTLVQMFAKQKKAGGGGTPPPTGAPPAPQMGWQPS
jgi:hypothetical protein